MKKNTVRVNKATLSKLALGIVAFLLIALMLVWQAPAAVFADPYADNASSGATAVDQLNDLAATNGASDGDGQDPSERDDDAPNSEEPSRVPAVTGVISFDAAKLVPELKTKAPNSSDQETPLIEVSIAGDKTASEDGSYDYAAGQDAVYSVSVNIQDDDYKNLVRRVYFAYNTPGYDLGDLTEGKHTLKQVNGEEFEVNIVKTDIDNVYYYEIENPEPGINYQFESTVNYPDGTTTGGTLRIWAEALTQEEAAELEGKVTNPTEEFMQLDWDAAPSDEAADEASEQLDETGAGTPLRVFDATDAISYDDATLVPNLNLESQNADGQTMLVINVAVGGGKTASEDGSYDYLTGQDSVFSVSVNNQDNSYTDRITRVYFAYDTPGYNLGELTEGQHWLIRSTGEMFEVNVVKTDIDNVYYYEIDNPEPGITYQFRNNVNYPNRTTPGGTLRIWAESLTQEQAAELEGKVTNPTDKYMQLDWDTVPGSLAVSKSSAAGLNNETATLVPSEDGEWLVEGVAWTIYESGTSSPESEGTDYICKADYEDVITLPEGISWREGVIDAIRNGNYSVVPGSISNDNVWTASSGSITSSGAMAIRVEIDGEPYYVAYMSRNRQNNTTREQNLTASIVNEGGQDKIKLSWVSNNPYGSVTPEREYLWRTNKLILGDDVLVADIDTLVGTGGASGGALPEIDNSVDQTAHYQWSDDSTAHANAAVQVNAPAGLVVEKIWTGRKGAVEGSDAYTAAVFSNMGILPISEWGKPTGEIVDGRSVLDGNLMTDDLNYYFYIRPENIESMLVGEASTATVGKGSDAQTVNLGKGLTITITTATLATPGNFQPNEGIDQDNKYNPGIPTNTSSNSYVISTNYDIHENNDAGARVKNGATFTFVASEEHPGMIEMTLAGDVETLDDGTPGFNGTYLIGAGGDYESVDDAFRAIGYEVTHDAIYHLTYHPDSLTLKAAQTLTVPVLGTYKNSFMLRQKDVAYRTSNSLTTNNTASYGAYVGDEVVTGSATTENGSTSPDVSFGKSAYYEGGGSISTSTGGQLSISEGRVLDYYLRSNNSGVPYETMTMTDSMAGCQVVLVSKEQNPSLVAPDGSALEEFTSRDVTYWVLNKPGTYTNVKVGSTARDGIQDQTADITVASMPNTSAALTGLQTTMIFTPKENWTGSTNVYYKVLVSSEKTGAPSVDPSTLDDTRRYLWNKGWLGDHQGHRLYYTTGWRYTFYSISKHIMLEDGSTATNTHVKAGQTVTYRLGIPNTGDSAMVLSGNDMLDNLPSTYGCFAWTRGDAAAGVEANVTNMRFEFTNGGSAKFNGVDVASAGDDYWSVTQNDASSYRIQWADDFNLTVGGNSTAYIYVDLTFPESSDDGVWDQYAEQVQERASGTLRNKFSVGGLEREVTHKIASPVKAVLYKGVYDTGVTTVYPLQPSSSKTIPATWYESNNTRLTYMNGSQDEFLDADPESKASTATYYVMLYNAGKENLYFDKLQDQLPRGFHFQSLATTAQVYDTPRYYRDYVYNERDFTGNAQLGRRYKENSTDFSRYDSVYYNSIGHYGTTTPYQFVGLDTSSDPSDTGSHYLCSMDVSAAVSEGGDGREHVTFTLSGGGNTDTELGRRYLNPGWYVIFAYNVTIDEEAETDDVATNTIAMPYYDAYDSGFVLDVPDENGRNGAKPAVKKNDGATTFAPANDGGCEMMTADEVSENFGMDTSNYTDEKYNSLEEGNWLVSSVSLTRANPGVPGIQKSVGGLTDEILDATSETNQGSAVGTYGSTYRGWTGTTKVVNWRLKLYNDSNADDGPINPIEDYTIVDTVDEPYAFTGTVFLKNNVYNDASGNLQYTSQGLFKLGSRTPGDTSVRFAPAIVNFSGNKMNVTYGAWQDMPIGVAEDDSDDVWMSFGSSSATDVYRGKVKLERNADGEEVITIHLEGGAYSLFDGGNAEIGLHTMYQKDGQIHEINTPKYNDSVLYPSREYDASKVSVGHARTKQVLGEDGYETVNDGIESGASVLLSMGFSTESWKIVTQDTNKTNTARSDEERTSIALPERHEEFVYDLYVVGPKDEAIVGTSVGVSMKRIVLIDDLPQEGDHSSFVAEDKRYSDFTVGFADDPDFKVFLAPKKGGTERQLAASEYKLYVNTRTEFAAADWDGNGEGWVDITNMDADTRAEVLKTARSVRLIIDQPDGMETRLMGPDCQVHFSFKAAIDDPEAAPGEVAWNSFGYRYTLFEEDGGYSLDAQPLKVGVRMPAAPSIEKRLVTMGEKEVPVVDDEGNPVLDDEGNPTTETVSALVEHNALENQTFGYLVYTGPALEALKDAQDMSNADIAAALAGAGRQYVYVPVTVEKGKSSAAVGLWTWEHAAKYDAAADAFVDDEASEWLWQDGGRYSVVELPIGNDKFQFDALSINGGEEQANNVSFVSGKSSVVRIQGINEWLPGYSVVQAIPFDKHLYGGTGTEEFKFRLAALGKGEADVWPVDSVGTDLANATVTTDVPAIDNGTDAFALEATWSAASNSEEGAFADIGYNAAGDYYYLIGELDDGQAGITYDKARYLARVTVEADAKGNLVASEPVFRMFWPNSEGGWDDLGDSDAASFTNNASALRLMFRPMSDEGYAPAAERVSAYPEVHKTVDGSTATLLPGEFTFELHEGADPTAEDSLLATASNDAAGVVAFFDESSLTDWGLVYDSPGTWTYSIVERAGTDPTVTYDDRVILLTVEVAHEDPYDATSPLKATLTYTDESGAVLEDPCFGNSREGMDLVVYKVSRSGGEGLENCTYALWMVGPAGDIMLEEATSDENGRIVFENAPLIAGQKYYFKEVEAPSGHTVDPYRTAYFSLNSEGTGTVLVEETHSDGWHSKYDNIDLDEGGQ